MGRRHSRSVENLANANDRLIARFKAPQSAWQWLGRVFVALLFLGFAAWIMLVLSPWGPMLGKVADYLTRAGMIAALLIVALLLRRNKRFADHARLAFGLFTMVLAVSLDWVFAKFLLNYLQFHSLTIPGYGLMKLNECIVVTATLITFTLLWGDNLGDIYLQKGNLKLGMLVGVISFVVAAAVAIPLSTWMFKASTLSLNRVLSWLPWILLFVLANATLEELLFRGLFLRKLEPFVGRFLANFLIAIFFTATHLWVGYTGNRLLFLFVLFPLALTWGYITQKTNSLWAAILFHAGMDIPIILGIFSAIP
jgi:membrane protease YdiL (CAAX protease family)